MSTNAHMTTHTETIIEKYNTMSLAVKTNQFKKYH